MELLHIRNEEMVGQNQSTGQRWRSVFSWTWTRRHDDENTEQLRSRWPWSRLRQQEENSQDGLRQQEQNSPDETRSSYTSRIWETASRRYRERQSGRNENTNERMPLIERFRRAALGANRERAEHVEMNPIANYDDDRDNDPLGVWRSGRGIENQNVTNEV